MLPQLPHVRPRRPPRGSGRRLGQIAGYHAEPAVGGPFDRVEQGLPPQRPIAIFIAMIDAPPVARRSLDERRMAARPPFFVLRDGADDRVVRAIFPRPMDRARRSEEHTSELQSLMRSSYAVFCLKKKNKLI